VLDRTRVIRILEFRYNQGLSEIMTIMMIIIIIIIIIMRTIPNTKQDIIIGDNEKGTYMLIDVANSGERSEIKKEAKKILKYIKSLQ
jgi:competence protein ComGC